MYLNLRAEMARKKITINEIASLLNVHRNSVYNKIYGKSAFSIDEAFQIRDELFANAELSYLFANIQN